MFKTKTFIIVLEAPRDQDPGLDDYITAHCSPADKHVLRQQHCMILLTFHVDAQLHKNQFNAAHSVTELWNNSHWWLCSRLLAAALSQIGHNSAMHSG